jgi:hypothetical protein
MTEERNTYRMDEERIQQMEAFLELQGDRIEVLLAQGYARGKGRNRKVTEPFFFRRGILN